jgi:Metallo-peptidase family M12B Reprolysin-like
MAKTGKKRARAKSSETHTHIPAPFRMRPSREAARELESSVHLLRKGVRCDTEKRGHPTPRGRSPFEIVVDASEGFIPLWAKNTTLRWRFRESSFEALEDPAAAKAGVENLFAKAVLAWGDATPVKFAKRDDAWDFEMFRESKNEQLETLVHEIGHIFGLRHFFAQVSEKEWPSQIFGKHQKFSIMNYGQNSMLTKYDKADLKNLYRLAWAGELTAINGTPIKFVKPFHAAGDPAESVVAVGKIQTVVQSPRSNRKRS